MLFSSVGRNNFKKMFFPIIPMDAIRYSCPIRLVPTYIPPAKERRLLEKFHPDSFKTERLVCVETSLEITFFKLVRI